MCFSSPHVFLLPYLYDILSSHSLFRNLITILTVLRNLITILTDIELDIANMAKMASIAFYQIVCTKVSVVMQETEMLWILSKHLEGRNVRKHEC